MNLSIDRTLYDSPHTCTGTVSPRPDFEITVGPGQSRPQTTNENDELFFGVECMRLRFECMRQQVDFGRTRTEVYSVLIPCAAASADARSRAVQGPARQGFHPHQPSRQRLRCPHRRRDRERVLACVSH